MRIKHFNGNCRNNDYKIALEESEVNPSSKKNNTIEIKYMHLADNKDMDEFEHFQMSMSYFIQKLIEACNLLD